MDSINNMEPINQNLSIFIPRVFNSEANEDFIKNTMKHFGVVERVDFVQKFGYFHAFVHFQFWHNNRSNLDIQKKLESKIPIHVVCNEETTFGRYFVLLKNNKPMTKGEVKMEKRIKELEAELEKVKQEYYYVSQQLQPLWCHTETNDSNSEPLWNNELACDYVNSTNESISSNTYLHSDEYNNNPNHDEVYDMMLVE